MFYLAAPVKGADSIPVTAFYCMVCCIQFTVLQSELKIIDFGLSRFQDGSEAMTTRVGTPYYIAPEGDK